MIHCDHVLHPIKTGISMSLKHVKSFLAPISLALIFLLPGGCDSDSNTADNPKKPFDPQSVLGFYSMFAPDNNGDTLIYARVIMNGNPATCPTLTYDSGAKDTSVRGLHPDEINNAGNFPVTVCETIIEPDISYSLSSTQSLQAGLNPIRVLVYGDTGCENNVCTGSDPLPPASPFDDLATRGLTENADLLLHMGDYNYRGTANLPDTFPSVYDAGDHAEDDVACAYYAPYHSQNASGSESGNNQHDKWGNWNADFFLPARDLLPTAPWVFARGNHELCSRAGPGWFYFFGPGSGLEGGIEQLQCPDQGDFSNPPQGVENHIVMIDPYFVKLTNQHLWVMDSANACDNFDQNPLKDQYADQFMMLRQNVGNENTWMMTHRPVGSINNRGLTPSVMLQEALKTVGAPPITLSLSGHSHIFQSITFNPPSTLPPQLIIGNSGVTLEPGYPATSGSGETAGGQRADFNLNQTDHGFLSIELGSEGAWTGSLLPAEGDAFVNCQWPLPSGTSTVCILIEQ
jgi:hypothetical protein